MQVSDSPSQAITGTERMHYMDAMRATLMMLGVVLHSAQVYNPLKQWLIYSDNPETVMMYVASFIHIFRMPAFFVVSGFFCHLTLQRYDIKKFLDIRIKRLVIPFLVTAFTLNSIQAFILSYTGWRDFDFIRYITNGGYVSHLWFLVILTLYFLFTSFAAAFMKKIVTFCGELITRVFLFIPSVVMVILLPFISIGILVTGKLGMPLYTNIFGLIKVFELCHYLPYFVFGMALSYKPELLSRLHSGKTSCMLICTVFATTAMLRVIPPGGLAQSAAETWYSHFCSWTGVAVCFYIFHKFLNNASKMAVFLSDASYTVYLFHHVLVVFFGLLCIRFEVSAFVGVPVMIIVIFMLTLLIHKYIILRFRFIRYLFNGK